MADDKSSMKDEFLFNPSILEEVPFNDQSNVRFDPPINIQNPGDGLVMRPLKKLDYTRGFLQLLSELTHVGDVEPETFLKAFSNMQKAPDTYYIFVIEDVETKTIVATCTLFIEQKYIHQCAKRARIEDVVVNDCLRGKQLGKLLIATSTVLAKHLGCYKISLDCRDKMLPYYSSLGFAKEEGTGNSMTIRY